MVTETVATPAPVVRFPIGLVGGVLATLGMDLLMGRLPEGATPPSVAAGVLTETHPDRAPGRLATVAHYLAGAGTGLLFVWLSLATEAVAGTASLLTAAATGVVLYVLMVGFFVLVPLPRAPGLSSDRRKTTARDWALSAAGYLLVLVPAVTLGNQLLG
ncbi:hypothetical protein GRX03_12400 [Halovenus sp. WSH3]|uniref:DUF2938 domain-containing protein n=1 Tax=Halovenus carboxidivorans TaxID=2692199 RepID=A0A6B0TB07_9EURY|nr:hypothetical protein [Halovenus carboxidivorans]MXR52401.1 hypothetical protein [Halovenus carboxidivorans]